MRCKHEETEPDPYEDRLRGVVVERLRCARCRETVGMGAAAPVRSVRATAALIAEQTRHDVAASVARHAALDGDPATIAPSMSARGHSDETIRADAGMVAVDLIAGVEPEPEPGIEVLARPQICSNCGKPATCIGLYPDHNEEDCSDEDCTQHEPAPACDDCCGHCCEDGRCDPIEDTDEGLDPDPDITAGHAGQGPCEVCHTPIVDGDDVHAYAGGVVMHVSCPGSVEPDATIRAIASAPPRACRNEES